MENVSVNNQQKVTKSYFGFYLGMFFSVASLVLYIFGARNFSMPMLWTWSLVTGAFAEFILLITSHSYSGWTRMFSVIFLMLSALIMVSIFTANYILL